MAKKIVFSSPIMVGDFPNQSTLAEVRLSSFSINAQKANRDAGVAGLSVMVESLNGSHSRNLVLEDASILAMWNQFLELVLPSSKTVSQALLEKLQTVVEPGSGKLTLPTGIIQDE